MEVWISSEYGEWVGRRGLEVVWGSGWLVRVEIKVFGDVVIMMRVWMRW